APLSPCSSASWAPRRAATAPWRTGKVRHAPEPVVGPPRRCGRAQDSAAAFFGRRAAVLRAGLAGASSAALACGSGVAAGSAGAASAAALVRAVLEAAVLLAAVLAAVRPRAVLRFAAGLS